MMKIIGFVPLITLPVAHYFLIYRLVSSPSRRSYIVHTFLLDMAALFSLFSTFIWLLFYCNIEESENKMARTAIVFLPLVIYGVIEVLYLNGIPDKALLK